MSRQRGRATNAGPLTQENLRIFGHCFLQSLMERGYLLELDAKKLYKRICSVDTGN
jgi:hypothetical protein